MFSSCALLIQMAAAGRSTHRVTKHMAAVQTIRDKTLHITSALMQSTFALSRTEDGLDLQLQAVYYPTKAASAPAEGTSFKKSWQWKVSAEGSASQIWAAVDVLDANMSAYSANLVSSQLGEMLTTFPCIVLGAWFDQFAIVRAPYSFSVHSLLLMNATGEGVANPAAAAVFCAQEIYDLCSAGNHIPGATLPLGLKSLSGSDAGSFTRSSVLPVKTADAVPVDAESLNEASEFATMILPHCYTPLLFALYSHYGRCLSSAINVSGDILALSAVSLQVRHA
jgi:hypothetical protein